MSQLEDSAAAAPDDHYEEEGYEQPLPLSTWAVVACILGIAALALIAPIRNGGLFVGLMAIIAANAARHDIKRGLKSGGSWATAGIWLGALAMVGTVTLNVIDNYS